MVVRIRAAFGFIKKISQEVLRKMKRLLYCARQEKSIFTPRLRTSHACHRGIVSENATKPRRLAHFSQGAESFSPATQKDVWTSKSGPNMWCFKHFHFHMCFAPRSGVHFFDIATSKSGPDLMCFVQFDLKRCFAPQ